MRKVLSIIQPTCCNILILNEIRRFFQIYRLFSRHAVTSCYIIRYGVFSDRADYSADMRNTFGSLALWQVQNSDYSADMRKSIPEKKMWPSDLFGVTAPACAPSNVISRSSQSRLSRRERRHTDATDFDPATPNSKLECAFSFSVTRQKRSRSSIALCHFLRQSTWYAHGFWHFARESCNRRLRRASIRNRRPETGAVGIRRCFHPLRSKLRGAA
jgi:hypothetical protein